MIYFSSARRPGDLWRITSFVVQNETMGEHLRLFREKLAGPVDPHKAERALASAPRINASKTTGLAGDLDPAILEKLRRKEDFLLRRFYPENP